MMYSSPPQAPFPYGLTKEYGPWMRTPWWVLWRPAYRRRRFVRPLQEMSVWDYASHTDFLVME